MPLLFRAMLTRCVSYDLPMMFDCLWCFIWFRVCSHDLRTIDFVVVVDVTGGVAFDCVNMAAVVV